MGGYTQEDYDNSQESSTPQSAPAPSKGTQDWAQKNSSAVPNVAPTKGTQEWADQNRGNTVAQDPLALKLTTSAQPVAPSTLATKPTTSAQPVAQDPNLIGYDQQIELLRKAASEYEPESKEQREKRERKEKAKRLITAVGDGIAAAGNLYFTSQGAPNMYSADNSTYNAVNAHLDKLKAERDANADKYRQYALKIGDVMNQRAATVREMEEKAEKLKILKSQEDRASEEHGWKADIQPEVKREAKGKADKSTYEAITAGVEANSAPQMAEAKLRTEIARGDAQNASAGASRASAQNSIASAAAHDRSNVSEFYAWDNKGRKHPFKTKAAAESFARQHGTWNDGSQKTTSTVSDGRKTKTTTTVKPGGGYAAMPATPAPATGGKPATQPKKAAPAQKNQTQTASAPAVKKPTQAAAPKKKNKLGL